MFSFIDISAGLRRSKRLSGTGTICPQRFLRTFHGPPGMRHPANIPAARRAILPPQ